MSRRREVRVTDSFFAEVDNQFGLERGPAGEPSATDFIVVDLPAIVEQFASAFDELPEATDAIPSMRMFIGSGTLAIAFVVHGIEMQKGVIHLIGIEVDP